MLWTHLILNHFWFPNKATYLFEAKAKSQKRQWWVCEACFIFLGVFGHTQAVCLKKDSCKTWPTVVKKGFKLSAVWGIWEKHVIHLPGNRKCTQTWSRFCWVFLFVSLHLYCLSFFLLYFHLLIFLFFLTFHFLCLFPFFPSCALKAQSSLWSCFSSN